MKYEKQSQKQGQARKQEGRGSEKLRSKEAREKKEMETGGGHHKVRWTMSTWPGGQADEMESPQVRLKRQVTWGPMDLV